MTIHRLVTPLSPQKLASVRKGDIIYLSGTIFTARDAAHKKMLECGMPLAGEIIYHAGPCPAKAGEVIGSIGPTTSYRMDAYAETFAQCGAVYSIGKGERSESAMSAIAAVGGAHFDAVGGAGAYYKSCVTAAEIAFFAELGAEAVYKLTVKDFPIVATADGQGAEGI